MKLTVEQWLNRIADPVIRESALRQMDTNNSKIVESIEDAITEFAYWNGTNEGRSYWWKLRHYPPDLLPLPETIPVGTYNQLFKHMADNHGLTLTDSELSDIINVVKSMEK